MQRVPRTAWRAPAAAGRVLGGVWASFSTRAGVQRAVHQPAEPASAGGDGGGAPAGDAEDFISRALRKAQWTLDDSRDIRHELIGKNAIRKLYRSFMYSDQRNELQRAGRHMKIIDVMTPEQKRVPLKMKAEERKALAAKAGASPADVKSLLLEHRQELVQHEFVHMRAARGLPIERELIPAAMRRQPTPLYNRLAAEMASRRLARMPPSRVLKSTFKRKFVNNEVVHFRRGH